MIRPDKSDGRHQVRASHRIASYSYSIRRGEAVLSETVLVLDGCSNCGDTDR